jgi:hypothetical protein
METEMMTWEKVMRVGMLALLAKNAGLGSDGRTTLADTGSRSMIRVYLSQNLTALLLEICNSRSDRQSPPNAS